MKTKYLLNGWGALIINAFILIGVAMIITRSHPTILSHIPLYGSQMLYQQATNFVISADILIAAGLGVLLNNPKSWKFIGMTAAIIVALNFIMEICITFINTRDIKDAFAGLLGVLVCLMLLGAIRKYGLTRNPDAS